MIIDTPPAAAAGSMDSEVVAVVFLSPVFVPVPVPVALPVVDSASVAVPVFVPVMVPVVSDAVSEAVLAAVVCSEVSAAVDSVSGSRVSIDSNHIRRDLRYLLACLQSLRGVHRATMAMQKTVLPATR